MDVLVTGSSGVLGQSLVPQLARRGDRLRLFDVVPTPDALARAISEAGGATARFEAIAADMRDRAALERAADGVESIFHLAAGQRMKPQFASLSEDEIYEMNLGGVRNVLDAARARRVRKVVFISSSGVYGIPQTDLVDEDSHPKRPIGAYGRSKLEAEELCARALQEGLDVSVLRPMSLFGDGMTGVFVLLFDWVRRGRPVFLLGNGRNRVQMVAAEDVARAAVLAAVTPGTCGLIANIGSDPAGVPTVRAQVDALIRHAGSASRVHAVPAVVLRNAARVLNVFGISPIVPEHYLLADVNFVLDISRARERLGWEPSGDNVAITCEAYDWYCRNWQLVAPKPNPALRILEAIT
ncbi:MAG TPA: NAD(P)-dependent oxidoreductase [Candidatus Binatia bacterium]|nr:NAD(P)-dependent oxidoreductase [Candidatus Binatia bacterium]